MAAPRGLARLMEELRQEGITDPRVMAALEKVPRDLFVPMECRPQAFHNSPLPIGEGQTISQPLVVALMTQSLALTGKEKVLEIGTGSGYQCAILAELSQRVVSMERSLALAGVARRRLRWLGYENVVVLLGDGSLGHPAEAPYDAIIVTASSPRVPQPLLDQLAEGGRLVLPVGSLHAQKLALFTNQSGRTTSRLLGSVRFVPLIGEAGWTEQQTEGSLDGC